MLFAVSTVWGKWLCFQYVLRFGGPECRSRPLVFNKFSGLGGIRDADILSLVDCGLADLTVRTITVLITYNFILVKINLHYIEGVPHASRLAGEAPGEAPGGWSAMPVPTATRPLRPPWRAP